MRLFQKPQKDRKYREDNKFYFIIMGDYALKGDYVLKGKEIEDVLLANAVKKVKSPLDVTMFAGIVAGIPIYNLA